MSWSNVSLFQFRGKNWTEQWAIEIMMYKVRKCIIGSILLSFMIPEHSFAFQKLFIELKRFFARRLTPVGFRCKPLLASFVALIFLLSILSISSWRRWLVSWLTVNAAFPSSVRKSGVEITLQLGRLSVIKDLSVRKFYNIFRDVE